MWFKTSLLKKLIVFVSECQRGVTAQTLTRQRTHVCQPERLETPAMNMPGLILNQQRGETLAAFPEPESTNGEEAQWQCVIHLNTVKLKAVYCSRRPFILLNARPLLANLSVRASTCQDQEERGGGGNVGVIRGGFS